jgi:putative acetyltransferase
MINDHNQIFIRTAILSDLPFLRILFRDTVLSIDRNDYSYEQLQAWATAWKNEDQWMLRFSQQQFFIAEMDGDIVGFASLAPAGYLDFLYVQKDFQRRGIAGKLLDRIELQARQNCIILLSTDASITAYPFFKQHGFNEVKRQTVEVNGVSMDNYAMQKSLT